MNRLKGLVWKAYKTRMRSPLATALDVCGPIVLILIYLCFKLIVGSLTTKMASEASTTNYFRAIDRERTVDVKNILSNHVCTKMLFHSQIPASSSLLKSAIESQCNLELTEMPSRDQLIQKLHDELDDRIAFKKADADLSRWTGSFGCVWLVHKDRPSFHVGLLITSEGNLEIYDTESGGTSVLFQPYSQGSTYNEYKFTASDLSSGIYLLNLCLSWALSGVPVNGSTEDPYIMRLRPLPATASPIMVPTLFMVFFLAANFCNAMATVIRISEENENGIHHYIRLSGVPASVYWSSQILVSVIQNIIQSLVLATLLAIPTNSNLFDPVQEANITFRWLLIVSYSFSLCAHAVFVASLFDRSSHAVLVTCLLAVGYCMYPFFFMLQWTPYTFSTLSPLNNLMLFNPVSNYQALLMVFFSVSMQTNQPLQFSHLTERIIGGGMSDWSLGALWLWLIVQGFLWYAATILFDHIYYSSSKNPLVLLKDSCQDLCFVQSCLSSMDLNAQTAAKSNSKKTLKSSVKSTLTSLDPNRICCSVKRLSITGPRVMMPQTNGNPLKLEQEQLKQLRLVIEENKSSITQRFMINRNHHKRSYLRTDLNPDKAPLTLEETFHRNITWTETQFSLQELNLDFRYNQVSFILGATDLKELLFESILGLKTMSSGSIVLDGSPFTRNTIGFARPHIGFLGERDIFLNELSIYDNLQFFGSLRVPYYTEFESESLFLLSLLHLKSRKRDFPSVLTSRSARKLALAVACVGQTKLLLLVEPTLGLRWRPRCHVLNLLKKYKSIRSIVVDTSDIDEATAFGDRVLLLKNGQPDLDGRPSHLAKMLNCGHWFTLEPSFSADLDDKRLPNPNLQALEALTSKLFNDDKLGKLVIVNKGMDGLTSITSDNGSIGSKIDIATLKKELNQKQTRKAVILKVHHSHTSIGPICTFLNMFVNKRKVHGFRLTAMAFESLEDVLVLRMSRAVYPNLPADLLISIPGGTIMDPDDDQATISIRRFSSDIRGPPKVAPIHGGSILGIMKDRLGNRTELLAILASMMVALVIVSVALMGCKLSLKSDSTRDLNRIEYSDIDKLYQNRIGFYLVNNNVSPTGNESIINKYLDKWDLNQIIKGSVSKQNLVGTDADFVAKVMQSSRDLAVSVIFYDYQTDAATVTFEPQANHALLAGMRATIGYKLKLLSRNSSSSGQPPPIDGIPPISQLKTTQFNFNRPWMEVVRGYFNRRFFYGLGFTVAEGIATGALVLSPIRHRSEFRIIKVRATYLTGMAIFDYFISLFLVAGYMVIIMLIEGTYQSSLISATFTILALYKLASIPVAYLVSLLVESGLNGFLFMVLVYATYGWTFSIHFRTFVEWTLIDEGLIYTISSWIIYMFPVSSLVNALATINHVGRIDTLCPSIPVHTPVSFLIVEEFEQKNNIISDLMKKVEECLMNGKKGISISVMHQDTFGILWNVYLIVVFGAIIWSFLMCSDRVYGLKSKKYASTRTISRRVMNTRRVESPLHDIFKWDKERDRLVSEYVRSLNDPSYVRQMNSNCFYLRLWLKPISDQSANDIVKLTEPIITLGEKVEIRMELKTTLQLFIRVGDEKRKCPLNRTQIIEAYSKFVILNQDSVTKFALVDWTRETLYKIIIHGHYNTKSISAVT